MTKSKKIKYPKSVPPAATILAAMHEDTAAMSKLLVFYRPYIRTLATQDLYDNAGYAHTVLDEQLGCQLEIKLIASLLKFEIR
ncbi:MAG: helix-turn-helix domain-containing protein [Clostridia bacterium]